MAWTEFDRMMLRASSEMYKNRGGFKSFLYSTENQDIWCPYTYDLASILVRINNIP